MYDTMNTNGQYHIGQISKSQYAWLIIMQKLYIQYYNQKTQHKKTDG